jgi:hypothetical protein
MNYSIETIRETFFRHALTCLKTSLLYHDMLVIFGNVEEVPVFINDIIKKRKMTGIIESLLTFLAFFHFHTLKNTEGFSDLKKFFITQGGNYSKEDFSRLEIVLPDLWKNNKKELDAWMMQTKLQTNEIARCSAVYPAVLSLGLEKINLIDLGCSAGLMLLMDLFSYEYFNSQKVFTEYRYKPLLLCKTPNPDKIQSLFACKTKIVQKIGLDLFPLDLNDDNNVLMLKAALWDDVARCRRLEQAIGLFNSDILSIGQPKELTDREENISSSNFYSYSDRSSVGSNRSEMGDLGGGLRPVLLALDYTQDLIKPLEQLININSEIVFYSSVTTYQIPLESYHQLLQRLKELAGYLNKKIYFIEFEELKKGQVKNVTPEEPFHITIHTFPEEKSYEFGRAHFHGNSLTIL